MADQHMECDGAAIAYEINGEGPPVGYAHGLFVSRRMERWLRLVDWTAVGGDAVSWSTTRAATA